MVLSGAALCASSSQSCRTGLRHATDTLDHLHRVTAVMLAHHLEHAARVLQRFVATDEALLVRVEVPRGLVVLVALPRRSR